MITPGAVLSSANRRRYALETVPSAKLAVRTDAGRTRVLADLQPHGKAYAHRRNRS